MPRVYNIFATILAVAELIDVIKILSDGNTILSHHPLMQHGMASFASASTNIKEDMKLLAFWIAVNKVGFMVGLLGSVHSQDAKTRSFLSSGLTLGLLVSYFCVLGPQLHVIEALGEIPQHSSSLLDAAVAAVGVGLGIGSWLEIQHYCCQQHQVNKKKHS